MFESVVTINSSNYRYVVLRNQVETIKMVIMIVIIMVVQ